MWVSEFNALVHVAAVWPLGSFATERTSYNLGFSRTKEAIMNTRDISHISIKIKILPSNFSARLKQDELSFRIQIS